MHFINHGPFYGPFDAFFCLVESRLTEHAENTSKPHKNIILPPGPLTKYDFDICSFFLKTYNMFLLSCSSFPSGHP